MVSLLAEDPGFRDYLPGAQLSQIRAAAVAPMHSFARGAYPALLPEALDGSHFGLLILSGLLVRHVSFGALPAIELVGPGDVVRLWAAPRDHVHTASVWWEVLAPSRMAELNDDFTRRVRPWPQVAAALIDRSVERADFQLLLSAVRQARRVEDRVHHALWHFAGRWGTSGEDTRSLHLPGLTGQALAHVVGARRQSVSTALGQLTRRGVLLRRSDDEWRIAARPQRLPQAAMVSPPRAARPELRRVADVA